MGARRYGIIFEWDIKCEHKKINSISPSIHVLFCLLYKHYYYPFPNMLRGSVFYWPRVRQKISKLSTIQKSNCRCPTTTHYIQMKMFSSQIITNKDGWKNVLNLQKTPDWLIFLHVKISYITCETQWQKSLLNTDVYIINSNNKIFWAHLRNSMRLHCYKK